MTRENHFLINYLSFEKNPAGRMDGVARSLRKACTDGNCEENPAQMTVLSVSRLMFPPQMITTTFIP